MNDWLLSQLDYLAFCGGLALLVSAAPSLRVARRHGQRAVVWAYYALFAIAAGLCDWLTMAQPSPASAASVTWLRAGLLTTAGLALHATGNQGRLLLGRQPAGRWRPAAGLLAAGLTAALGGGDAGLRLALLAPAALLVSSTLWRFAPEAGWLRRADRLAATCLLARTVALCWPGGEPLAQALMTLASVGILLGVCYRLSGRSADTLQANRRVDLSVALALLASALLGWYGANHHGHRLTEDLRGRLLRQVVYLARTVSPAQARRLTFTAADRHLAADQELRAQMRQYNRAFGLWNTYSLARRGSQLVFGPESLDAGHPLASPPGTVYDQPAAPFWQVFQSREAIAFGPYTDEYGTFHSAVAPVIDPRSGEALMAVGVDMQAADWMAEVRRGRAMSIWLTGLMTALLLAVWMVGDELHARSLRRPLALTPDAIVAALTGLVLTAAAAWLAHDGEERRRAEAFRYLAEAQAQVVAQTLRDADSALDDAAQVLSRTGASAVTWPGDRVKSMAGRGGIGEVWWAPATSGTHFSVAHQTPLAGVGSVIGVDLAAEPALREAVAQALRSGSGAARTPVTGRLPQGRRQTLLVVRAVGQPGQPVAGLVVGVLDPQQVLHHALAMTSYDGSQVRVGLAELLGDRVSVLSWHPRESDAARDALSDALSLSQPSRSTVFPVFLFGRTLALGVAPSPSFDARNPARAGWRTLGVGALLTTLLALLVNGYGARRDELERQVAARTASLRDSEERFRSIVEAIPDAIFIANAQGRFVMVNQGACRQLGYTADELLSMGAMDIVAPPFAPRAELRISSMTGDAHLLASAHRHKDGTIVPVEVAVLKLDLDGQACLLGIARDVTERLRAEQALRDSEAYRRRVFESSLVPIVVMDATTLRFVDANPAAAAVYGYESSADLLGKTPLDVSDTEQYGGESAATLARQVCDQAMREGSAVFEWRHVRPNGEVWDAEVHLMRFEVDGSGLLQFTLRDVTERRRLAAESTDRLARVERQHSALVRLSTSHLATASEQREDPGAGLTELSELVSQTMQASRVGIWLIDNGAGTMALADLYDARAGTHESGPALNLADYPRYVAALTSGRAIDAEDAIHDPRTAEFAGSYLRPLGISSMLDAAVRVRGEVVGVLCVEHTGPVRAWRSDEIGFVGAAADLIALRLVERERSAAEQALRASEANYRLIASNMSEVVWSMDLDGRFTFINPAIERLTGWTPEEYLRKSLAEALTPEALSIVSAAIEGELTAAAQPGFDRGRQQTMVIPQRRRDGSPYWAEVSAALLWSDDGVPNGIIGITRDITDRLAAEAALRESEAKLRAVFEQSPSIITLTDPDGRYAAVSRAFEEMTGISAAAAVGHTAAELGLRIEPDDEAMLLARLTQDGRVDQAVVRSPLATGGHGYYAVSARVLDLNGGRHILTVLADITAQTLAQQALEQTVERLAQSNAELERFTYTVSHDLKSPLITIKGFLSWLRADLAKGRADRIESSMDRIANAAEHMGRLLDELLELSRIGRLTNSPTLVSMTELAREAAELVNARLEAGGVAVTIAPDMPSVVGDRPRLLEVLQNLLDNAAKFMGEQPRPRVAVGCEGVDTQRGWPIFTVRDNGQGFDPAYAERIFGLFDQLDPKREGTGIGLAMVKRIVEVHGGRAWAESDGPGAGACFSFTLPPEGSRDA